MIECEHCLDLEQLHELNLSLNLMTLQWHLIKYEVLSAHTFGPYRKRGQILSGKCTSGSLTSDPLYPESLGSRVYFKP